MQNSRIKIKVDKTIQPLHFSKRTPPNLVEGNDYYISFGLNIAHPCKLIEIIQFDKLNKVRIGIKTKSGQLDGVNEVFADEIGTTPEEAVINTHTS